MFNFRNVFKPKKEMLADGVQEPIVLDACSAEKTSNGALWNPRKFLLISILFSFFPAAIMYSINYKRSGYASKGKIFFILSLIAFTIFVTMIILLPGVFGRPLAMGINVLMGTIMSRNQLPLFKEHIAKGGKKASLLIPLITCIAITLVGIALIIFSSNFPESKLSFGGDDIYFTPNVKEADVRELGQYFVEGGFFKADKNTISVKIDKNPSGIYILSIMTDKQSADNTTVIEGMGKFAIDVSSNVFNNVKVEIVLCDNGFNKLRVINP